MWLNQVNFAVEKAVVDEVIADCCLLLVVLFGRQDSGTSRFQILFLFLPCSLFQ